MADSLQKKQLIIFLVVSAYWVISISLIFVNKFVLTNDNYDAPIFVTLFQSSVSCALLFGVGAVFGSRYGITVYKRDISLHFHLLSLTNFFVGMVIFNNFTLKMIPVSYYNIVRALSTVFNLIFTKVLLKRTVSIKATLACLVVVLGYIMGLTDTGADRLPMLTVIVGLTASMFVSLYAIYTQSGLEIVERNQWLLQNMVNINTLVIVAPLIFISGEASIISNFAREIFEFKNLIWLTLSGILGFVIGIFTNLQIKYTSALTHNISGTAKSCVQTIIAVIAYRETHGFWWWIGSILVLVGSALYSYVRNQEMINAHQTTVSSTEKHQ